MSQTNKLLYYLTLYSYSSEGISTGAMIGISLAAILFIAICVGGALVLAKKQKIQERRIEPSENNINNIQNISGMICCFKIVKSR